MSFLHTLDDLIQSRKETMPEGSYTTDLFGKGIYRIAQKVGEEGVEVALAGVSGDKEQLKSECSDLLYHMMVLLRAQGLSLKEVEGLLQERHESK